MNANFTRVVVGEYEALEHSAEVLAVATAANTVATGCRNGLIYVWDLATNRVNIACSCSVSDLCLCCCCFLTID